MWQGHLRLDTQHPAITSPTVSSARQPMHCQAGWQEHPPPRNSGRLAGQRESSIFAAALRSTLTMSTDFAKVGGVGASQRPNFVHVPALYLQPWNSHGPGGSNHKSCLDNCGLRYAGSGTFGNLHRNFIVTLLVRPTPAAPSSRTSQSGRRYPLRSASRLSTSSITPTPALRTPTSELFVRIHP